MTNQKMSINCPSKIDRRKPFLQRQKEEKLRVKGQSFPVEVPRV